ncbi:MAG: hypothetical protein V1744_04020 [Candidatus Altiarchaeota archaeon]
MRRLILLLIVAVLGCISADEGAITTTTMDTTISTSTSTSTTIQTIKPLPALAVCDSMNASFWQAICYDDAAYGTGDIRYCRTFYCRAKFNGADECARVDSDATDWFAYKRRACEAWAAGVFYACEGVMRSEDCIRWYALLGNNMTLCIKAQNSPGEDCAAEFAYWRGNINVCATYKTVTNRVDCEARYYIMAAADGREAQYCDSIMNPMERNRCRELADYAGDPRKHPLYGVDKELLGVS